MDRLRTPDGHWVIVDNVLCTKHSQEVFNLEVEDAHTYFVALPNSGKAVWVHNSSFGAWLEGAASEALKVTIWPASEAWKGAKWTASKAWTGAKWAVRANVAVGVADAEYVKGAAVDGLAFAKATRRLL